MQESATPYCSCEPTHSLLESSHIEKWYSDTHFEGFSKYPPPPMSSNRILKNVILVGTSHFLVLQTAQTLANLQSTINGEEGIGICSLAVQYGMAMVCILLFSEILIRSFGCRKMLVVMIALQLPYHASNFYPGWETMIPTSAVSGATLGLIVTGVSLYINEMSMLYHSMQVSESLETITARFCGIFAFFAMNSSIWGNLMSYYILMPSASSSSNHSNVTCGIDFNVDSLDSNDNLQPPSAAQRNTLVAICLSSTVLSVVLLVAFVDELDLEAGSVMADGRGRCRSVLLSLSAALRHACVPDQLLLIPLPVFFGMQNAFFTADFTQAYIACSWGVYHIGFVTMCYGACGAVMGCCVGKLVNLTSQTFAMFVAAFLNALVIVFLTYWRPSPDYAETYFIVAGIWGIFDSIWWSQLAAVHGLIFPKNSEAAFSVMYFCVFLGFTFTFSTSNYLSVRVKIVINSLFFIIGMAGYLIGQMKIKLAERRTFASST